MAKVATPSLFREEAGINTGRAASSVTAFVQSRCIAITVSSTIATVKESIMQTKEMSAIEAARKLGIGLGFLYSLVWTGKLDARKVNRQWRVSIEAVEARLKARDE
jgi:excisionase family DNA binding protein